MAKKTRKQKQRTAARRTAPPPRMADATTSEILPDDSWAPSGSAGLTVETEDVAPLTAGITPEIGARRRIERVAPAAPAPRTAQRPGRGPSNAAAMFQPLDSDDAAIPFDRVPYVPADLRRVAIMAALMVVLIIIAALIVTNLVK